MKNRNSFAGKLYGRIWSIWFALLLVIFKLIIFPAYYFLLTRRSKKKDEIAHKVNMLLSLTVLTGSGITLKVEGKEHLDPKGTYVFTPNHNSYLDIPICNIALNRSFRYIGKKELSKIPLFGWMYERLYITVNRSSHVDAYKSMVRAGEKLDEGVSMLIYPEGTISRGKKILSTFKEGAFRIACKHQVPIVPVSLIGTDSILPDQSGFRIYPGKVRVIIHPPVSTIGVSPEDSDRIKLKVFEILHTSLKPYYS
jgi:1-acyl-sn-glycerol-3-phosphate acyltransferase